jgi:hypothetical protein
VGEADPHRRESEQVGEVGDRQQQRGGVGEVSAGIDVRRGAHAGGRGGGHHRGREEHHRGVEGEHGGRDCRGDEHERQQRHGAPGGAGSHRSPGPAEHAGSSTAVADHEHPGEEAEGRPEVAGPVAGGVQRQGPGGDEQRRGRGGHPHLAQAVRARNRPGQDGDEQRQGERLGAGASHAPTSQARSSTPGKLVFPAARDAGRPRGPAATRAPSPSPRRARRAGPGRAPCSRCRRAASGTCAAAASR